MSSSSRLLALSLGAAALLSLAACGSSTSGAPAPSSPAASASAGASAPSAVPSVVPSGAPSAAAPAAPSAAASVAVTIKDFAFTIPASVSPGAMLSISNKDSEAHTFTLNGGKDGNVSVPPGATMTLTAPSAPGSYKVTCQFHADMKGTLVVQ